jgi:hypothetical protein
MIFPWQRGFDEKETVYLSIQCLPAFDFLAGGSCFGTRRSVG